jgi:hypothetical protein
VVTFSKSSDSDLGNDVVNGLLAIVSQVDESRDAREKASGASLLILPSRFFLSLVLLLLLSLEVSFSLASFLGLSSLFDEMSAAQVVGDVAEHLDLLEALDELCRRRGWPPSP